MKKRSLSIFAAVMIIVGIITIIKISENISLIETFIPEKLAVIKNVHLEGIYSSSEAWEVEAKEAWTGRDRFSTTLEHVTKAQITKNGRPVIVSLTSRRMRINKNKDIEVFKSVDGDKASSYFKTKIDLSAIKQKNKKTNYVWLTSDSMKLNPDTKKAFAIGNVRIQKKNMTADTDSFGLDLDNNKAYFPGKVVFIKEKSRMSGASAEASLDSDSVNIYGSVEVKQKNKTGTSINAVYNDENRTINLIGKVIVKIDKLKDFINITKEVESEEGKKTLEGSTIIYCDSMLIYTDSGNSKANGRVHIVQKDQEARSETAVYSENNETIEMTGNVSMKKEGNWVKADKVRVLVDKEIFEAKGNVETIFNIKKPKRKI